MRHLLQRRRCDPGKIAQSGRAPHEILRAGAREGTRRARVSCRPGGSPDPGAACPGLETPGGRDLPHAGLPGKPRLSAARAGDRGVLSYFEALRVVADPFAVRTTPEGGAAADAGAGRGIAGVLSPERDSSRPGPRARAGGKPEALPPFRGGRLAPLADEHDLGPCAVGTHGGSHPGRDPRTGKTMEPGKVRRKGGISEAPGGNPVPRL